MAAWCPGSKCHCLFCDRSYPVLQAAQLNGKCPGCLAELLAMPDFLQSLDGTEEELRAALRRELENDYESVLAEPELEPEVDEPTIED